MHHLNKNFHSEKSDQAPLTLNLIIILDTLDPLLLPDIGRTSYTTRACSIVRNAIRSAMSSVNDDRSSGCESRLTKPSSSLDVEFNSPVSMLSRVTGEGGSTDGEEVPETMNGEHTVSKM